MKKLNIEKNIIPNKQPGRPAVYSQDEIQKAVSLLDEYSYSQVSQITGISVSTLHVYKRRAAKMPQVKGGVADGK